MSRFSEKENFKKPKEPNAIPTQKILNIILRFVTIYYIQIIVDKFNESTSHLPYHPVTVPKILDLLFDDIFEKPLAHTGKIIARNFDVILAKIPLEYDQLQWFEKFDMVQFFVEKYENHPNTVSFIVEVNTLLEKENSIYRLTKKGFVKNTTQQELDEIDETIKLVEGNERLNEAFTEAMSFLFDRKDPKPNKAVSQIFNVFEIFCADVLGFHSGQVTKSYLNELKTKDIIDEYFHDSIAELWNYSNNAENCRHGGELGNKIDFYKAKYVVVTMISFINMLNLLHNAK